MKINNRYSEKDSFKIVGKAYNPNYLSYEKGTSSIGSGNVDTFIYVNQDVIKADYYTEADLLVTESQALNSYSDEYFDVVEPVTKEVDTLAISQIAKYKAELQDELDLEKEKLRRNWMMHSLRLRLVMPSLKKPHPGFRKDLPKSQKMKINWPHLKVNWQVDGSPTIPIRKKLKTDWLLSMMESVRFSRLKTNCQSLKVL